MIKEDFTEYYDIVKDILENKEFQKRKEYPHHEDESVYEHSLKVSILAYRLAKKNGFDYRSAAIGGLLHDFYSEPWQNKKKKTKLFKMHGFVHAKEACVNAEKEFGALITPKITFINAIFKTISRIQLTPSNSHKTDGVVNSAETVS